MFIMILEIQEKRNIGAQDLLQAKTATRLLLLLTRRFSQAAVGLLLLPPALALLRVPTEACHSAHTIAHYEEAETWPSLRKGTELFSSCTGQRQQ